MSDTTKTVVLFDDLSLKHKQPNHLAQTLEKQAAAGARLPRKLASHLKHLQTHTTLVQQALKNTLPKEVLAECSVVFADSHRITLSAPSATVANHIRYITNNCVQALRMYDERFCHLQQLGVIVRPTIAQSESRQTSSQKTLSENTKRIITQTANHVISNDALKQALMRLANDTE